MEVGEWEPKAAEAPTPGAAEAPKSEEAPPKAGAAGAPKDAGAPNEAMDLGAAFENANGAQEFCAAVSVLESRAYVNGGGAAAAAAANIGEATRGEPSAEAILNVQDWGCEERGAARFISMPVALAAGAPKHSANDADSCCIIITGRRLARRGLADLVMHMDLGMLPGAEEQYTAVGQEGRGVGWDGG